MDYLKPYVQVDIKTADTSITRNNRQTPHFKDELDWF